MKIGLKSQKLFNIGFFLLLNLHCSILNYSTKFRHSSYLESFTQPLSQEEIEGDTPLHIAARALDFDNIEKYLENGIFITKNMNDEYPGDLIDIKHSGLSDMFREDKTELMFYYHFKLGGGYPKYLKEIVNNDHFIKDRIEITDPQTNIYEKKCMYYYSYLKLAEAKKKSKILFVLQVLEAKPSPKDERIGECYSDD
jgi:ankyrin repeat protein